MIRLFHLHYPVRALVFWAVEAVIVFGSLVLGVLLRFGDDSYLVLNFEYGYYKIFAATAFVLLFSHWFDLYDLAKSDGKGELYFRLLSILGLFAVTLSFIGYVFPAFVRSSSFPSGLIILAIALFGWRRAYSWLEKQSYLRERVYVLGAGERAQRLVSGLRNQSLGIDVVGWSGGLEGALTREAMASHLVEVAQERNIHRVIVAPADRRGTLPVDELLQLRLSGVEIEEATTWLEKIYGRIEVEHLYPSWLIFADGFRFSGMLMKVLRRLLSILASAVLLVIVLPLIPLVILAIKLDSPGPILYRQARVGFNGIEFFCYKFRTMRQDAEADTGPTWALDDDPRITIAGRFLRLSRLDEIPQLWNVLKGDMAFVGPRPERPEFVEWLSKEIPFYSVRHAARPGVTGWAQIRYKYGNTLEDAKEKLQYDLYYLKNASIGLDLLIMFQTIKIVLWEEVNDVRTPLNMPALSAERRNPVVPPPKERSEFGYRVMLVFSFLYYFHPDDIIPGLSVLHLARITTGIAILALLLGANKTRPKTLPVEVKLILAMFGWMLLGIPFAFWRAGSLTLVLFEFSKAVVVTLALSLTVSRLSELRLLILIQAFSVGLMAVVAVIVNNRMQGRLAGIGNALLSNPNDLAMNIALNWPLCLVFFLTTRGFVKKTFWALSMLIMIYAVMATYSRAGFIALSLAILLCLWDFGVRGRRVYMLGCAAACVIALVAIGPSNYAKRLQTLVGTFQEGDLDRGSAGAREDLLFKSLHITAEHPIFGIGPGNFQAYTGLWHVTHNTYTQFSSECGVPVLLLFLMLLGRAFRNLRLVRKISRSEGYEEELLYANALRASLVAYVLGAFFSSTGFELFPYYMVVYTLLLYRLTSQKQEGGTTTSVVKPAIQFRQRLYRPA